MPVTLFQPGEELALGEIPAKTFSTSHDAPGSCGYVLGRGAEQVAVCTDLGTMSGDLFETIRGSGTVLLECNHDLQRLWNGPYPYPLKQRILSDRGHLSNAFSAKVAVRLCQTGTRRLLLAHLSAENNTPQLALSAVRGALEQAGLEAHVALAPRSALGEPILL